MSTTPRRPYAPRLPPEERRTQLLDAALEIVAEEGLPGVEATAWFGLQAPARTPRNIVQRYSDEMNAIIREPEMQRRLADLVTGGMAREALVRTLESDYGWRATGCPPSPPTAGCLQYQQVDALINELKGTKP